MGGKLPPRFLWRRKVGFGIPAARIRFQRIQCLANAHWQRPANLGYHLWGLLTHLLWIEKWQIQTTRISNTQIPIAARPPAGIAEDALRSP